MTNTSETRAITVNTVVSVGMLLVVIGAVASGARWAARMEAAQERNKEHHTHSIELIELKIDQVRADIAQGVDDRYRRSDARAYHKMADTWIMLLKANNRDLVIPEWPDLPAPVR